jgi:hypothetical protein
MHVAYLWYNLIGAVACVGSGLLVALVAPRRAG